MRATGVGVLVVARPGSIHNGWYAHGFPVVELGSEQAAPCGLTCPTPLAELLSPHPHYFGGPDWTPPSASITSCSPSSPSTPCTACCELDVPKPQTAGRAPLRIALVLDRSGSMAGRKLDVAKECAAFLARRLDADDALAFVTYDDTVQLVRALAPADATATGASIDAIWPGGSTNLSGGWLKGLEELGRADDGVRRVLLLTDGLANVGIVDHDELISLATGTKAQAATTTIGFGDGFDEDLLTAIADASGGATYYAADPDDVPGIFAEEFEGLATLVVQNVSVEIRPNAAVELLGVLNEYPIAEVPGGLQAQIGDGYGGERRRIVFQLRIPELAELGPAKVADVVLRYVTVGDQIAAHETTIPVVVNLVSADDPAAADLDQDVVDEVVLLQAARAKKQAMRQADAGVTTTLVSPSRRPPTTSGGTRRTRPTPQSSLKRQCVSTTTSRQCRSSATTARDARA